MSTTLSLDSELMRRLREKWEAEADDPARPPDLSLEQWLFSAILGAAPHSRQEAAEILAAIIKKRPAPDVDHLPRSRAVHNPRQRHVRSQRRSGSRNTRRDG